MAGRETPPSPRKRVVLDKLKPPPRHRKQPPEPPEQQVYDAVKGRNERRTLRDQYRKKYQGRHRKGS